MRNLMAARDIAALKLPDLPTTKVAIAARAEREGWYSEERTGLGGTRRVYEVPARYLAGTSYQVPEAVKQLASLADRHPGVDLEMLRLATVTLEEWLLERSLTLAPEKKADIIAVLYDYLAKGANRDEMSRMLKALAA